MDSAADEIGEEEDLTAGAGDLESVLSLGRVRLPNHCRLRWHYRSRHASLIDFSNGQFYDRQLRVFPSPHTDCSQLGVSFRFVADGVYLRGAGRTNPAEAAAVAAAVLEHARRSPGLSLGVGTLNLPQQEAIQDELERLMRENCDPAVEAFFANHAEEPFFVKNLENIQGDERDVIFLSIGFGRDPQGKLTANFGALNAEGGWRRLNVLVTRARAQCVVFSSIRADDISPGATSARGVAALREYLRYAESTSGPRPSGAGGEGRDESAVRVVEAALREAGWETHRGVGSEDFAIDLAVVDPLRPGRYLLGIETDGPAYRACPTARDRDRTRPSVLRRLGWNLVRVWSPDLVRDRQGVVAGLLKRLEELKAASRAALEREQAAEAEAAAAPPADPPAEPEPTLPTDGVSESPTERGRPSEPPASELPEGVVRYPRRKLASLGKTNRLLALRPQDMAKMLSDVLGPELPMQAEEAVRLVADRYDTRLTAKPREAIEAGLKYAVEMRLFRREGDFVFPAGAWTPVVRWRDEDCPVRGAEQIAPAEYAAAAVLALRKALGLKADDLADSALRLLGFARSTAKLRSAALEAVEMLRQQGAIREDAAGFLVLGEGAST